VCTDSGVGGTSAKTRSRDLGPEIWNANWVGLCGEDGRGR
jgi:hypothetical protein